ncbi:MAG TPA: hypothetical protein VLC46_09115 [Thermoanaerobaculia bacterium]|jgi:hypothetical protein|nr:hypothetical protein [Thermoanaerobaculia bacterium]
MVHQIDPWDEVKLAFNRFSERLADAPEIIATGFKGFTYTVFTRGGPAQAIKDILNKVDELDRQVKAHNEAEKKRLQGR